MMKPLSNFGLDIKVRPYKVVHSSTHIKRRVLDEGALQPVIGLLSSDCPESQREAGQPPRTPHTAPPLSHQASAFNLSRRLLRTYL